MSDQSTIALAIGRNPSMTGSGFSNLSPEIQGQMYRRFAGLGLLYSGAWVANYIYYRATPRPFGDPGREIFWHITTALSVLLGLAVYFLCRKRQLPARYFSDLAVVFEIVGGLGIMAGYVGWEHHGALFLQKLSEVLGIGSDQILAQLVEPLNRAGLRLLYADGISWVTVWILVFPLVIPMPWRRTAVATLATAATAPGIMTASLIVNGTPETVRSWILPYMMEVTVPTLICAGIAIYGSRVVYRLTRDLSHARQMGSYLLEERIGEGGMGEVWRAKHRLLVRPAAIKLIRAEALGQEGASAQDALRRFEREAQATAMLSSPHSIALYDFGTTDEGAFYYVMELLRGVDLKSLIERFGPVPPERAVHILRQACHSLDDAHRTGLIHRDIKPGNIFVCHYGNEFDFVKVLDFGLVKRASDTDVGASQLTTAGLACGTPGFMAPEMAYGSESIDARADLYGLGCVGYWLLTGQLVFDGGSPMEILVKHAKDAPIPPSVRSELDIPADLERVILDCLEKEPAKRPSSARELARRLAACEPSGPGWTDERSSEWWQRHLPTLTADPRLPAAGGTDETEMVATVR
ncbi:MAG: serine/threonine-protein kinase [Candidatus Eisenbacteria bacterium]|uniref:Serine/threonine protein kinase n=1 Tax=Eiseniibacteriota bacterium TaxID=2212470 RepID=A0A956RQT9_UNCEI|nr:serine/threonine protein kinase [Candidatus Eisenbacteria bacterium]